MYYACLEYKDGHIEKVPFVDRTEARRYIRDNWDEDECVAAWIKKYPDSSAG